MAMIQFTRNYTDRSNDQGFQFEFHCDKCGNGHMSTFEGSTLGMAASFLKAAGSFFGGALSCVFRRSRTPVPEQADHRFRQADH